MYKSLSIKDYQLRAKPRKKIIKTVIVASIYRVVGSTILKAMTISVAIHTPQIDKQTQG